MIIALVFGFFTMVSEQEGGTPEPAGITPCDSVMDRNLELEIRVGRYEVALEILKGEDSAAAHRYQTIIETQTE